MKTPRLDLDYFLQYFAQSEKPKSEWKIGLEQELLGFWTGRRQRLSFADSIDGLMENFSNRFGWKGYFEDSYRIGLKKDGSSITLEPGGQLEFSVKPIASLLEVEATLLEYQSHLQELSTGMGWTWLSMGYDPFLRVDQIPWVPKARYKVMGEYLPPLGEGALHMMKATCTAQSNLDYSSEADMVSKMRVATAVAPFVNILFASSPFAEGRLAGCKSRRGWTWSVMSPRHSGFLDLIFQPDFGYRQYIEYILDVPMLVLERGPKVIDTRGENFRQFLKQGFGDLQPEPVDWKTQLGATFPIARLRNAIETRTADAGPLSHLVGQAAFWKGLLYDPTALAQAEGLIAQLGYRFFKAVHDDAFCKGFEYLDANPQAEQVLGDLVGWSKAGLVRIGLGEERLLEPVERVYEERASLADRLIKGFKQGLPIEELVAQEQLVFAQG